MKTCPACQLTYADDTLNFCLNDGAMLSEINDSQATAAGFRSDEPEPTEIIYPAGFETAETVISPPTENVPSVSEPAKTVSSSLPQTLPSSPRQKYQPAAPFENKTPNPVNQPPQFQFDTAIERTGASGK